jgi:hypothetical protein
LIASAVALQLAGPKALKRRQAILARLKRQALEAIRGAPDAAQATVSPDQASSASAASPSSDQQVSNGADNGGVQQKKTASNITARTIFLDDLIRMLTTAWDASTCPDGVPDAVQRHVQALMRRASASMPPPLPSSQGRFTQVPPPFRPFFVHMDRITCGQIACLDVA